MIPSKILVKQLLLALLSTSSTFFRIMKKNLVIQAYEQKEKFRK
jgi:hypothetical protein